ncbi:MAG: glycosyltransferase family 2 protein [Actinobacteria bacterium]|nr:glycosyltransferase family 2 protein [Actinomycetota bacterium]
MRIAVLITCFNRKTVTLNCLQALFDSDFKGFEIEVFIVDGGSTDGTVLAIIEKFPEVQIEIHEGLYWNRGMIAAWKMAVKNQFEYEAFLLLNDDVCIHEKALSELVSIVNVWNGTKIAVGYTTSATSGSVTYGGLKRKSGISRIRFEHTKVNDGRIVTINGNCALVPRRIFQEIGMLDSKFQHSFGDIDYGLRATKAGFGIETSLNAVANMDANITSYSGSNKSTIFEVYALMKNPKGLPIREWLYFTRSHAGFLWPVNFIFRYFKMLQ